VDPLVILFGFGVGILIGMTGIGGGSLMTPLLILFAGVLHRSRARASAHRPTERATEVAPA